MRKFIYLLIVIFSIQSFSQELNCEVVVNAQLTGNENVQVFKTLERQLKEFINNTTWTNKTFKSQERITCSMVINITDYNSDNFEGSIQVQSARPVYGSSYSTPVYNYNDKDFHFRYLEFQNMVYNETQYESNLISVLAFHVYMILGMDADTFSLKGGAEYYTQAQVISNYSQQGSYKGWKLEDGQQSRFILIDNVLSDTYKEFREVLYGYHRNGLDEMNNDTKAGKLAIAKSIGSLKDMNNRRPNSYLMRVFFDAKSEEIEDVFSGGPTVNISDLVSTLTRIAPMHASKWRNINF
ncbi:type IX secretion system protein PorD [Psychroserpens sp.]